MSLSVKVQKLDPDMPTPKYVHFGDAAFDLYAREKVVLKPGEKSAIASGVALEIPEGYVGFIWDKSGLAIKHGLKTLGGVIDAGYRGEVLIGMVNTSSEEYIFEKYHKVAQMVIQKVEPVEIQIVSKLSSSERGEKGFGSSGK